MMSEISDFYGKAKANIQEFCLSSLAHRLALMGSISGAPLFFAYLFIHMASTIAQSLSEK